MLQRSWRGLNDDNFDMLIDFDIYPDCDGGIGMTREIVEGAKESIIPFIMGELRHYNVNGNGEAHAEQAKKDLEEIFSLAIKALEQEPTTKNNLGIDREQLKTMIRGLTKWYVKRDNTEVGEPNTAVGLLYDDVMFGIDRLPSVTPQEPKTGHWIDDMSLGYHVSICSNCNWRGHGDTCLIYKPKYCPNCGCRMVESQEGEEV